MGHYVNRLGIFSVSCETTDFLIKLDFLRSKLVNTLTIIIRLRHSLEKMGRYSDFYFLAILSHVFSRKKKKKKKLTSFFGAFDEERIGEKAERR
jgi:hypothetical protein